VGVIDVDVIVKELNRFLQQMAADNVLADKT
jgi:hypothetical protein